MYVDDSKALALLIIGRCNYKPCVKAIGKEKRTESTSPRHEFAGEGIEIGRRAEAMERNPNARTVFLRRGCLEVGFGHGISARCFEKRSRLLERFVSTVGG